MGEAGTAIGIGHEEVRAGKSDDDLTDEEYAFFTMRLLRFIL
jgi:hypothetical protein